MRKTGVDGARPKPLFTGRPKFSQPPKFGQIYTRRRQHVSAGSFVDS